MKRTKIVCTIGPASASSKTLEKMIKAGMDVARLNFSHGTYDEHAGYIKTIRQISKKINKPVAIMQDLQGPRLRVGDLGKGGIKLKKGGQVILTSNKNLKKGSYQIIPLENNDLAKNVKKGDKILLENGLIELKVIKVEKSKVYSKTIKGGITTSFKGINLPGRTSKLPSLTSKDKEDLKFGLEQEVDFVAISFVKSARDILTLKKLIYKYSPTMARKKRNLPLVVAKIEKQEAIENFDKILKETDGVMVARGDLGIETPAEEVPIIQKELISKCLRAAKPVIVATQMLDSMIRNSKPTRAEVSDVANAVVDHTDAVMLSGETATGKYPVESVKMMNKIIEETEESPYDDLTHEYLADKRSSISAAVANAAHELSKDTNSKAILAATMSGLTARMIARHRPEQLLLVMTNSEKTHYQLCLSWGVESFVIPECSTLDELVGRAVDFVHRKKLVKKGQKVILVTGQPVGILENMNLVKVQKI